MNRNHKKNTFLESIRMEFVLFIKSMNVWAFLVLWFVVLVYFCSLLFTYSQFTLGDAFISQGLVTQALLTGGIILGAIISSNERKEDCEEVFCAISRMFFYKNLAKVVLLLTISLFVFVTGTLTVFIVFHLLDAAGAYYIPSTAYILLYWVLPFFISGMMGCIIGQAMRSKMVYPIVIGISVFIGPLVPKLAEPFMLTETGAQYQIYMLFNLGDLNLHATLNESYGYCLNKELWIARLSVLIGIFLMLPVINRYKRKDYIHIRIIAIFVTISLVFIGILAANRVVKLQNWYLRQAELIDYYSDNPEPDFGESINDISSVYEIMGYDINIDDGLKLNICTDVGLDIKNKKSPLVFTLFHGFEIVKCTIDGKEEEYKVAGDALIVENTKEYEGKHLLRLEYKGIPPANLYKASNKWILPGMFAWIPVEYVGKVMANEWDTYAMFNYPDSKKDVPIKVEYIGNNEVFCSLDEKDDKWEGISSGITMACGWLDEKETGKISVVYPSLYPENVKQAGAAIDGLLDITRAASKELKGEDKCFEADKIFVFPSLLHSYSSSGLYFFRDHIVMCIFFDQGGTLIESIDGRSVVDSVARTNEWNRVDRDVIWIFEYAYLESLCIRGVYNGEGLYIPPFESLIETIRDDEKRLDLANMAQRIHDYISVADVEKQIEFFRSFLELIDTGSNVGKITRVVNELLDSET